MDFVKAKWEEESFKILKKKKPFFNPDFLGLARKGHAIKLEDQSISLALESIKKCTASLGVGYVRELI